MNSAVIYARVSSREQEQEGYSIPAQLKALKEYAFKNGFKIEREFVDIETAKTAGRTHFGEMAHFLKASKNCRAILVEKKGFFSVLYAESNRTSQIAEISTFELRDRRGKCLSFL